MTSKFWIINLVLFQLAWFTCALLTAHANWILPIILVVHFTLSVKRIADTKLLLFALIGTAIDFLLYHLNIIYFQTANFPFWLLCLWAMFAISINHSLYWLKRCQTWSISLIGALGGATSYLAAVNFGAILSSTNLTILFITYATVWALLLPIMIVYQSKVVESTNS